VSSYASATIALESDTRKANCPKVLETSTLRDGFPLIAVNSF
jgi:hypothetical protein